jgi:hypothetical protein
MISNLLPDEVISRELLDPTELNPLIDKRYRLTGFPESWKTELGHSHLIDKVAGIQPPSVDVACCGEMNELIAKIQNAKKQLDVKLADWKIIFHVPGYYEKWFMAPFRFNMQFQYHNKHGILDHLRCVELVEDLDLKDPQFVFEIEPMLAIDPNNKRKGDGITDRPFVVEMSLIPVKILSQ